MLLWALGLAHSRTNPCTAAAAAGGGGGRRNSGAASFAFVLAWILVCAHLPQLTHALTYRIDGPTTKYASIADIGQKVFLNTTCALTVCEMHLSLPFQLQFGARTVTSILVSTNGVLSLDASVSPPSGWSTEMTQIAPGSSDISRIALIQAELQYGSTAQSGVYYHCKATSCIISYEDAVFVQNINATVSAQVEMYVGGEVELRYGAPQQQQQQTASSQFVSGIQDDALQQVNAPSLFAGCNATGMCATDAGVTFPANQGMRFSWLPIANVSTAQSLATSVGTERSRALSAEKSISTIASSASATLATELSNSTSAQRALSTAVRNEVSRAYSVESVLLSDSAYEVYRAGVVERSMTSALGVESSRAMATEESLGASALEAQASLTARIDELTAAAYNLSVTLDANASTAEDAVDGETSRALAVDESIGTSISAVVAEYTALNAQIASDVSTNRAAMLSQVSTLFSLAQTQASAAAAAQASLGVSIRTSNQTLGDTTGQIAAALDREASRARGAYTGLQTTANTTLSAMHAALQQSSSMGTSLQTVVNAMQQAFSTAIHTAFADASPDMASVLAAIALERSRAIVVEASLGISASQAVAGETSRALKAETSLSVLASTMVHSEQVRAGSTEASMAAAMSAAYATLWTQHSSLHNQSTDTSTALGLLDLSTAMADVAAATLASTVNASAQDQYAAAVETFSSIATASLEYIDSIQSDVSLAILRVNVDSTTVIRAEKSRAQTAEAQLSVSLSSGTALASTRQIALQASVAQESVRASAVEQSIAVSIQTQSSAALAVETSIAIAAVALGNEASSRLLALQVATASETTRAMRVEGSLAANQLSISTQLSRALSNTSTAIQQEVSRAQTEEARIQSALLSSATFRLAIEVSLGAAVVDEDVRGSTQEGLLLDSLAMATAVQVSAVVAQTMTINTAVSTADANSRVLASAAAVAQTVAASAQATAIVSIIVIDASQQQSVESSLSAVLAIEMSTVAQDSVQHSSAVASLYVLLDVVNASAETVLQQLSNESDSVTYAEQMRAMDVEASLAQAQMDTNTTLAIQLAAVQQQVQTDTSAAQAELQAILVDDATVQSQAVAVLTLDLLSVAVANANIVENSLAVVISDTANTTELLMHSPLSASVVANEAVQHTIAINEQTLQHDQALSLLVNTTDVWTAAVAQMNGFLHATLADLSASVSQQIGQGDDTISVTSIVTEASTTVAGLAAWQSANTTEIQAHVSLLSAQSEIEVSRAIAVELSLSSHLSNTVAAGASMRLQALNTAVSAAVAASDSRTANLLSQLVSEQSRRIGVTEASLSSVLASSVLMQSAGVRAVQSAAATAQQDMDAMLQTETTQRSTAVALLHDDLNELNATQLNNEAILYSELSVSQFVETGLSAGLQTEVSRASAAEENLAVVLANETLRAISAEDAEQARAGDAETGLESSVWAANMTLLLQTAQESVRARTVEASLALSLASETSRALDVEASIRTAQEQYTQAASMAMSMLNDSTQSEVSRAMTAEASLTSAWADVAVALAQLVNGEIDRQVQATAALSQALAQQHTQAQTAEDTLFNIVADASNHTQQIVVEVAELMANESVLVGVAEASLLAMIASGADAADAMLNGSGMDLQQYIDRSSAAINSSVDSATNAADTGAAASMVWRNALGMLGAQWDAYLTQRPTVTGVTWTADVGGATPCTQCVPSQAVVCMATMPLVYGEDAVGVNANVSMFTTTSTTTTTTTTVVSNTTTTTTTPTTTSTTTNPAVPALQGTYEFRVYMFKTNPAAFVYQNAAVSMDAAGGTGIARIVIKDAGGSCLSVTAIPTTPPPVLANRRRGGGSSGGNDMMASINNTLLTQSDAVLWNLELDSPNLLLPFASSSPPDCQNPVVYGLIVWNAMLTFVLIVLFVKVISRYYEDKSLIPEDENRVVKIEKSSSIYLPSPKPATDTLTNETEIELAYQKTYGVAPQPKSIKTSTSSTSAASKPLAPKESTVPLPETTLSSFSTFPDPSSSTATPQTTSENSSPLYSSASIAYIESPVHFDKDFASSIASQANEGVLYETADDVEYAAGAGMAASNITDPVAENNNTIVYTEVSDDNLYSTARPYLAEKDESTDIDVDVDVDGEDKTDEPVYADPYLNASQHRKFRRLTFVNALVEDIERRASVNTEQKSEPIYAVVKKKTPLTPKHEREYGTITETLNNNSNNNNNDTSVSKHATPIALKHLADFGNDESLYTRFKAELGSAYTAFALETIVDSEDAVDVDDAPPNATQGQDEVESGVSKQESPAMATHEPIKELEEEVAAHEDLKVAAAKSQSTTDEATPNPIEEQNVQEKEIVGEQEQAKEIVGEQEQIVEKNEQNENDNTTTLTQENDPSQNEDEYGFGANSNSPDPDSNFGFFAEEAGGIIEAE